jgi:hypothetical protein
MAGHLSFALRLWVLHRTGSQVSHIVHVYLGTGILALQMVVEVDILQLLCTWSTTAESLCAVPVLFSHSLPIIWRNLVKFKP